MSRTVRHPATKTIRTTVARALTIVQRSNSWCSGQDLSQDRDSQGKIRSAFCLRGAIRAAIRGTSEGANDDSLDSNPLYLRTEARILETLRSNPAKYGVEHTKTFNSELGSYVETSDYRDYNSVVDFNDAEGTSHKNVVRLLRDTLSNLG